MLYIYPGTNYYDEPYFLCSCKVLKGFYLNHTIIFLFLFMNALVSVNVFQGYIN